MCGIWYPNLSRRTLLNKKVADAAALEKALQIAKEIEVPA